MLKAPVLTMASRNALDMCTGAFVDALARAGVTDVVACPGSRSTPLALLMRAHPAMHLWMHLDERSAGYFALGMAKAAGRPIALLATSGTASVNFAPAVTEARYGRVPLVVLTADRPPELRELGAPQTINQTNLFGSSAKWWIEMPLPEATEEAAQYGRLVAARAATLAREAPAGPVHVNLPFREPLTPAVDGMLHATDDTRSVVAMSATRRFTPADLAPLAEQLRHQRRGIIVCGPQDDPALAPAVAELAAVVGYPILADALSQVRVGSHDRTFVIDAYDALVRDDSSASTLQPDVMLRFGAIPTSKSLVQFMQRARDARQIVVDNGGWPDPIHAASMVYQGDSASFCRALVAALGEGQEDCEWIHAWRSLAARACVAIESLIDADGTISEPAVFTELSSLLPSGAILYAGNSMPVRDLDTFFNSNNREILFLANRGANGIDGVVSSALGASAMAPGPVVLVLGDLSFYHDMNGLLAARRFNLNATIVLVNNNGGGIFSFLPQADAPHFEELFGTPHGLPFRAACELYDIEYERAETRPTFRDAVVRSIEAPGVQVIEVPTRRDANVTLHREIWQAVSAAMAEGT